MSANYRWLVLVYSLPPGAGASRVRIWRKLKRLGTISFRNSVYFLPYTEENFEILQWLCQEIQKAEGEATLLRVERIENLSDNEVAALFRAARDEDYAGLIEELGAFIKRLKGSRKKVDVKRLGDELRPLERRFREVEEIDFFGSAGAQRAQTLLRQAKRDYSALLAPPEKPLRGKVKPLSAEDYQGLIWVTRPQPHVDRIASAWVVSRFIDLQAQFDFAVKPTGKAGHINFDYPGGELSHQGEDCTMETLIRRFSLKGKALKKLAEVVHDADLKDRKFGAEEAAGLDRLIRGLIKLQADSLAILGSGFLIFDALYLGLGGKPDNTKWGAAPSSAPSLS